MDDGRTDGQTDGHTDDQCETIIPRHYCVAGYKNSKMAEDSSFDLRKKNTYIYIYIFLLNSASPIGTSVERLYFKSSSLVVILKKIS